VALMLSAAKQKGRVRGHSDPLRRVISPRENARALCAARGIALVI